MSNMSISLFALLLMLSITQTIQRILQPLKTCPWLTALSAFFSITRVGGSLLIPYLLSELIIAVETGNQEIFMNNLHRYIIVSAGIWLCNIFLSRIIRRYMLDQVRIPLYKKHMKRYTLLSNNYTDAIGTGKANSIIQKGCDNRGFLLNNVFVKYLEAFLTFCAIMLWIGFQMGAQALALTLVLWSTTLAISLYGNKRSKKARKKRKDYAIRADKQIVKYIMSKFEILGANKVHSELGIVNTIFKKMQYYGKQISFRQIVAIDVVYFVVTGLGIAWLFYAGMQIINGTMLIGTFTLWWMLLSRLKNNIENIAFELTNSFEQYTHIQKLWELHDYPHQIEGYFTGKPFVYHQGDIQIHAIDFEYPLVDNSSQENKHIHTTKPVFRNFSLHIQGGQKTALVGKSGSGKSTLVKLITGYLRPTNGSIRIDEQDLRDISLQSFYQHIGYLTQEPSVFDGTIQENLHYALQYKPDMTAINKALERAQCQFVYDLPHGIQTQIGERGIRLSGGQRQRLALAKIFLKNPQILILDEPTAALDSFSEEAVTQAMHELYQNRTVIIIAHRLQTVKEADDIIVLDEGQVVQRGSHKELLSHPGQYADMLELQSGF